MPIIVTSEQCASLLDYDALREAVAEAHRSLSRGEAIQPVPARLGGEGPWEPALIPMAARRDGLAVVKLLVDAPGNRDLGRPAQRSTVALFDAETAECVALVDGRELTRRRTAAVSAIATAALAAPGASVLGLVGAGDLAVEHVRAHTDLGYRKVTVWSRTRARVESFAACCPPEVEVTVADSPAAVFGSADVVCTLTPAETPFVTAAMLRPGQHVNAVGSPPRPLFREIRPDALARADAVCVDLVTLAETESGNIRSALDAGAIAGGDLVTLGDVLEGRATGRRDESDVTIFNSVGIGLQDLAAATLVLRRVRAASLA